MQKSILKIKLNIGLPFIPPIPLLGRTEIIVNRSSTTQSQMYAAALFTVAKCSQQMIEKRNVEMLFKSTQTSCPSPTFSTHAPRFNIHGGFLPALLCMVVTKLWFSNSSSPSALLQARAFPSLPSIHLLPIGTPVSYSSLLYFVILVLNLFQIYW